MTKSKFCGVAWVTGAGKGIGRSLSRDLATMGRRVARTEKDLLSLKTETGGASGEIAIFPADIENPREIQGQIDKIQNEIGPIQLAILNAGTYIRFGLDDFSIDAFKKQLDVNVMGTVNCLAPLMHEMKIRRQGHIVIVSSLSSYRGLPFASAYGASKAALTNMCEALKPELEKCNVKISVVHPGFVRTPLTEKNKFEMPFLVEADYASRQILKGIWQNKFEIVFPPLFGLILKFLRILPYSIYFTIMRKLVKK